MLQMNMIANCFRMYEQNGFIIGMDVTWPIAFQFCLLVYKVPRAIVGWGLLFLNIYIVFSSARNGNAAWYYLYRQMEQNHKMVTYPLFSIWAGGSNLILLTKHFSFVKTRSTFHK